MSARIGYEIFETYRARDGTLWTQERRSQTSMRGVPGYPVFQADIDGRLWVLSLWDMNANGFTGFSYRYGIHLRDRMLAPTQEVHGSRRYFGVDTLYHAIRHYTRMLEYPVNEIVLGTL